MHTDFDRLIAEVTELLPQCLLADRAEIGANLEDLRKHPLSLPMGLKRLERALAHARRSREIRELRATLVPQVGYPSQLPLSSRKDDIVAAIHQNQVIIVAGETGSGKTTQIPKMCLEAGLGVDGRIGCTQPRRVAAWSVARRVAEELGVRLGRQVGCKIRFADQSSHETLIKFMTDGILLAETQGDRDLREYEAIIIDEAHERSLNIDFLLGHLKGLLARRPDLKLVITSATINTGAFSLAFGNAPVIEVSGRTYPVEVQYAPLDEVETEAGEITYVDAAANLVERILIESERSDILVFMPGERDIRETCELLQGRLGSQAEIIPMFGRLASGDQQRVFVAGDRRKIVIATNIAETSLTIPGIRFVIDAGLARVSKYSPRTRTKRLPIEPVSQSSANQRKGRAGRVESGVCIRLYSEEDFLSRPEHTQPEIQRANLAEVILRMHAFHLGEIETFPFLNPPSPAAITAGYQLLEELGALDRDRRMTALGRDLARLPVDPTVGRMLLQARSEGCVKEMLIIAAGLSIQDPRERPAEAKEAANQAQKRFEHPQSDFLTLLNLWNAYHGEFASLRTQNQMRKFCKSHFVSYSRMREWTDLHAQLEEALDELNPRPREQASRRRPSHPGQASDGSRLQSAIHRSVLSGLLDHVAHRKQRNIYKAAGDRELMIFPGSVLFDRVVAQKKALPGREGVHKLKQPEWVVAGEIVETSRLYARTVARVETEWIADLGRHLCKVTYDNPHWDSNTGKVLARERTFLRGLELINRSVFYGNVAPREATEIFIRSALVGDQIDAKHRFIEQNRRLRQKIELWLTRLRHRDLPDLDQAFFKFYAVRIENVSSVQELNRFIHERSVTDADGLCATESEITGGRDLSFDPAAFPDNLQVGLQQIPLQYAYAPGEEFDGVTVQLPIEVAQTLEPVQLQWIVPALREEQASELLRNLPKSLRVSLMPLAPKAVEIASVLNHATDLNALSRFVWERYKVEISPGAWDVAALPNHLRPRFEITSRANKVLATGRDLEILRQELMREEFKTHENAGRSAWAEATQKWERYGLKSWSFGDMPEMVEVMTVQEVRVFAYPALQVEEGEVSLRLLRNRGEAESATARGFERLCEIALFKELAWMQKDLRSLDTWKQLYVTLGPAEELKDTAYTHLKRHLFRPDSLLPLRESIFARTLEQARGEWSGLVVQLIERVAAVLKARQEILLCCHPYPTLRAELDALVPSRFLEMISWEGLRHLPRYLKALLTRAERAALNRTKDAEKARQLTPFVEEWRRLSACSDLSPAKRQGLSSFRWMLEEFKVSVFAQELGTAQPVSVKRLREYLAELQRPG